MAHWNRRGQAMQILVDLVKLGAIGASLAFLVLAFFLLRREQALRDNQNNPIPPRKTMLAAIGGFMCFALIFLLVGVISEFILKSGTDVLAVVNQLLFRNELVRVRFNSWEYSPEKNLVAFGFEEN